MLIILEEQRCHIFCPITIYKVENPKPEVVCFQEYVYPYLKMCLYLKMWCTEPLK